MRNYIPHCIAALVALALMGIGLAIFPFPNPVQPLYASEVADKVIADMNAAAPKFPRKPLLSADVKVLMDSGHGSAIHIGDGFFVTAAHVAIHAKRSKRFDVKFTDNSIRKAEVLWINEQYDIAMLWVDPDDIEARELLCEMKHRGDMITILGNPFDMESILTSGRIAGEARSLGQWKSVYILDATAGPGNSGGPVFDDKGNVVGILVGGMPIGLTLAVPSYNVCHLLARV